MDASGDGKITKHDLEKTFLRGNLGNLTPHGLKFDTKFWERLLEEVDTNKDGEIDFQEFETYMMDLIN